MKRLFIAAKNTSVALIRNRIFQAVALITALFMTAEIYIGDPLVRLAAESARIAVFAALAATTCSAALQAFKSGAVEPGEQMVLATFLLSSVILMHAIWIPMMSYGITPPWMPTPVITSALIIGMSIAGIGYIVPIVRHRTGYAPVISSMASVFFAGMFAGAIFVSILFAGVVWP